MSIDKNSIPIAFQELLMKDEEVLAAIKNHSLCILVWWLNPINFILFFAAIGIVIFLYKLYDKKNEVIILSNKRVIETVIPNLFKKVKIELPLKTFDNIIKVRLYMVIFLDGLIIRICKVYSKTRYKRK